MLLCKFNLLYIQLKWKSLCSLMFYYYAVTHAITILFTLCALHAYDIICQLAHWMIDCIIYTQGWKLTESTH